MIATAYKCDHLQNEDAITFDPFEILEIQSVSIIKL